MATRHTLGNSDDWFIGDRRDPYSHKIFEIGDTIVVCAACKSPHLEDTWGQNPNRLCSVCDGNGALLEFEEFNDTLFQLVDTGNGILRPVRHFDPEAQIEAQRLEIERMEAEVQRLEEERRAAVLRQERALQAEQELIAGNEQLQTLAQRLEELHIGIQTENDQHRETVQRIREGQMALEQLHREVRAESERRENALREVQAAETDRVIEAQEIRERHRQRVELLRETRLRQEAERYRQATFRASERRRLAERRQAQMLETKILRESRR